MDSVRGRTAPFGTWPSPVTGIDVARGEALLEWVGFCGEEVWWTEARPEEGGRNALVRRSPDGRPRDVLPPGWDVRSRVIEYGGRPWAAVSGRAEDGIVFSSWPDQRVYRWVPGADPVPISPRGAWPGALRYCDFSVRDGRVWCLRETVTSPDSTEVVRHLVTLPIEGGDAEVVAATHHFMTGPRLEPGGRRVAWLGWDHPAMPWHRTDLMLAEIGADGRLGTAERIAGGPEESVTQITWAAREPGSLYAVTDPGGWWNVHQVLPESEARNLLPRDEEFGEALWRIGARWCLPLHDGRLAVVHGTSSRRLGVLSPDARPAGKCLEDIESPYGEWQSAATDGRRVAAVVSGPAHRRAVVVADTERGSITVVREPLRAYDEYASEPFRRTFKGTDGEEVHAHIYPPYHPGFRGGEDELPPYVIFVHGGPTNRSHLVINQEITYFTSRGFGIADVQYGGSTGLGRAYRERLDGAWGVVDVRDCATVARGLIAEGMADPRRLAIRGGSAGGWTAAASLAAEPELYKAAGIYFPVLDLEAWRIGGTHDFESRYLDSLVGPWPESRRLYRDRSPANRPGAFRAPFALFQGLDDNICPPAQARALLDGIQNASAIPCEYLTFEGEGHGFRRAETIATCLEAELALYTRAFVG